MKTVPVASLVGESLAFAFSYLCKRKWLVGEFQAHFEAFNGSLDNNPFFNWTSGGDYVTLDGEFIRVSPILKLGNSLTYEAKVWDFNGSHSVDGFYEKTNSMFGDTPLLAVMRAYVSYQHRTGISIPDELIDISVEAIEKAPVEISVSNGIAVFNNGETVNILKIQKALYDCFQDRGDTAFHEAMLGLAKLSGASIGTYGEFSYD